MKKSDDLKSYLRFVKNAAEKAFKELNKDEVQKLIENGDKFQVHIISGVKKLSAGLYANEEVESSYRYFSGYTKPKGITEQTDILSELLPGIGFANEDIVKQSLPANAEGWFAIPRWQSVGRTYKEAVEKIFELIKKQGDNSFGWHEGKFGEEFLRKHERTMKMLEVLGEAQKGYNILVVPAQFGLCHRGRSVRRAREVFQSNEFGLGVFETLCMLFTHLNRIAYYNDLRINCAGDEFSPDGDGNFSSAPCFRYKDGRVRLNACRADGAYEDSGSVSAFLPQ